MKLCNVYYIAFSAFLLNLPFLFPTYFFWLVFVSFTPIFYLVLQKQRLSFYQGFLWGVIFFSIHWIAFFSIIITRGTGPLKWVLCPLLVTYAALHSGIWFWLAQLFNTLYSWFFCTILFLTFFYWFGFWILDGIGYPFFSLVIPLAQFPKLLYFLPYMGEIAVTSYLVFISLLFALFVVKKSLYILFFIVVLFLPFFYSGILEEKEKKSLSVGFVPAPKNISHPYDCAQEITQLLSEFIERNPDQKVICMAEGAFPFPLNKYPQIIEMWTQNVFFEDRHLFIGAHKELDNKLYNCVYWITNDKVANTYDKQVLVPLFEYIPAYLKKFGGVKKLFLQHKSAFCKSKLNTTFEYKNFTISPLICSDLFLGKSQTIFDLVFFFTNESWFDCDYMIKLMQLFVQKKALLTQKSIYYIGHNEYRLIT